MPVIQLLGCRLRPIGSYLKALGVLRIVGEQLDPGVTGSWVGDTFRLESTADEDTLVEFFVETYSPTPIVAPWNKASGLWPVPGTKDKAARSAVSAIAAAPAERFVDFRSAIASVQQLTSDSTWLSDTKDRQISRCRAMLPDRAVEWLDASVVLANDGPTYPPLFGTGGNDGVLDFSSNFMQRLVELLIEPRRRGAPAVRALLGTALFGADGELEKCKSGQYDPASADSDTTSASGQKTELSNPWDFVFLIEGGLVFASAAARRLGTSRGIRAAMPFCVDASRVGSASSGEGEETHGEIWAPVWRSPSTIPEIARLIGEGRAQWGRDQAGNGVDFAKAAASLGVDRGIDRFVRHGIMQRNGKAFFAVPMGEVIVGARPEVNILRPVDRWIGRLKRQLPAAAASARRQVEAAEYRAAADLTTRPAAAFQQVLISLAALERAVSRATDWNEMPWPVGGGNTALPASEWLPVLDDGTPELRIAVALASARDRFSAGELTRHQRTASSLVLCLRAVELDGRGRIGWSSGPPRVGGVAHRPVFQVLADALVDREIRIGQRGGEAPADQPTGVDLSFDVGIAATPSDLVDLAEGRIGLERMGELLQGLLLLDWRRRSTDESNRYQLSGPKAHESRMTPAMATLLPFFHGDEIAAQRADGSDTTVTLRARTGWARQLAAGKVGSVLDDAVHRLRMAGLRPAVANPRPTPAEADGALVIAALCRVHSRTIERFIRQTCPSDPQQRMDAEETNAPIQEDQ